MRIRDDSDLAFEVRRDHERAVVERLDAADVEALVALQASDEEEAVTWLTKLVGGR